jgi:hypothetical protein
MTILQRSCTVMAKNTLASIAFATGCAIALSVPSAQAQVIDAQGQLRTTAPHPNAGHGVQWIADNNKMESGQYEHLLRTNSAFRQSRIQKECGVVTDPVLHVRCEDSFSAWQDEPSLGWDEKMNGGSSGMMNSTGAMPYGPNTYDPGAGR